jgi:two-component system CheB/CheR fusion protein
MPRSIRNRWSERKRDRNHKGEKRYVDATVVPLIGPNAELQGSIIMMDDVTEDKRLRDELKRSNEELQELNAKLETTNEELESTNEELETTAEELQSTAEELETSNEELQSTNEELETSNEELRSQTRLDPNDELKGPHSLTS